MNEPENIGKSSAVECLTNDSGAQAVRNIEHRSGEGSVPATAETAENGADQQVRLTGDRLTIISADVHEGLKRIAEKSVQCVVTSPPYWGLRSYLPKGHPLKHLEIGQEKKPDCLAWAKGEPPCGECFVCTMRSVFGGKNNPVGVWRVLRDDGTVWLNLGDSYASAWAVSSDDGRAIGAGSLVNGKRKDRPNRLVGGLKEKDLCMVPMRVALALQADGWYLRSDIIWAKRNCMPESVTDRPTRSHEYLFLLAKSPRYFYDAEAIKEPCIYDVDGQGTAARKARSDGNKLLPTGEINGIRQKNHQTFTRDHPDRAEISKFTNGGYKNSVNFEGKNKGNDKQRGHSRRHDGFNSRWDAMEKEEQCTGMRNKRDVWTVSPANYPEAHFATFPPELIKPCILAGSSAGGACPRCGSPLKRKTEVGATNLAHQKACGGDANGEYNGESTKDHASHGVQDASAVKARVLAGMRDRKTIGWEPTCKCQDKDGVTNVSSETHETTRETRVLPCIVVDPFGGSGTTGEVALELGRRAIVIELNPNYLPLIEQRTNNVTPGLQL